MLCFCLHVNDYNYNAEVIEVPRDFSGRKFEFYYKKVPERSFWDFPGTKQRFYYKKSPGGLRLGLSRDKTAFFTTKKVPEDSVWDF